MDWVLALLKVGKAMWTSLIKNTWFWLSRENLKKYIIHCLSCIKRKLICHRCIERFSGCKVKCLWISHKTLLPRLRWTGVSEVERLNRNTFKVEWTDTTQFKTFSKLKWRTNLLETNSMKFKVLSQGTINNISSWRSKSSMLRPSMIITGLRHKQKSSCLQKISRIKRWNWPN